MTECLETLRSAIAAAKLADEADIVGSLLARIELNDGLSARIEDDAAAIVNGVRDRRREQPILDSFLQEYGLSNAEGVALMCLAEALLRIPDGPTRDDLISDKIGPHDWARHLGKSQNGLVNASTWGLMLTGGVVRLDPAFSGAKASAPASPSSYRRSIRAMKPPSDMTS